MSAAPQVVIIAGPNGAGKTTSSEGLLKAHGIRTFLNADRIASGLSGLSPDDAAIEAGIRNHSMVRNDNEIRTPTVQELEEAFAHAVQDAYWRHRRLGESIVVCRDGKIVTLTGDEIPVDEETERRNVARRRGEAGTN